MFQRVLVLAPHTDDGEFGCGGTIAKLVEEGADVYYLAFSAAEKSVPKKYPNDILRKEVRAATQVLGIPADNLIIMDYEVRNFPLQRQEILEDLVRFQREMQPDLVLLPALHDIHQDHMTIAREGLRAFKTTSMLGYELLWNNLTINTTSFVFLEERHIRRKVDALKCYESQRFRRYASEEFIYSLARTRGTQIGAQYAEAFEVIRWVLNGRL
ncbi:MAG: PIG-L family deacetylase [Caldilineae bacterium]|nr:MAG: PIG-L family deacetylase [Caldilineae bacterium]